ncbi:MAG: hypothetical protein HC913_03390 [Microscillaceae bacterium]|nr:hypothetical protein [Microscillaceae bacterium]
MNDLLKTILIVAAILLGFGVVGKLMGMLWFVIKWALIGAGVYVGYKVIMASNKKQIKE